MEIRDLRFFCLTAELEHVTRAADKLGVAQPFLTKIIGQMEDELGVPLFDKVGRKIKLNKYGEIVYRHGKKVLAEIENLHEDVDAAIENQSYTIKITTNGEFHYPELFLAYHMANPDYTLSFTYASREEAFSALRTGDADFVICSPPLQSDPDKGIKTEFLFKEYPCVMLPPDHPALEDRRTLTLEDLEGIPLVTTSRESALRQNVDRYFAQHDYHPQIICESNDISLVIRMVKSGLGFAVLPRSVIFSSPSLRKYCVDYFMPGAVSEIGLSYSTTVRESIDGSNFPGFIKTFITNYNEKYYKKGIEHVIERDEEED